LSAYELHIGVKDYCFGRENRLIGVSVMQLKDIMDQVQCVQINMKSYDEYILKRSYLRGVLISCIFNLVLCRF